MLLISAAVFTGVFLVVVLLLTAMGTGASQQMKQTLERLDAVLLSTTKAGDEVIDIRRQELLSTIPWLNRLLQRMDLFPRLRLLLYQADLNWTVGGLLLMSVFSWVVVGNLVYWRTHENLFSNLMGLAATMAPIFYVRYKRSMRFNSFEEKLPNALDLMVSALRAGHSLNSAIGTVAKEAGEPVAREFKKCFDEQNFGLELRNAMENLARRVPIDDVRMMVTAILIQKESGGNLAEILEKAAHIIRDRFRLKRQIRVHTAQGRLTGWILSILPVVLGLLLYLVDPENMSLLWKRPIGLKMLYAATVMTIIGGLIIRKIVRVRV
jgi:tight adherence protein B